MQMEDEASSMSLKTRRRIASQSSMISGALALSLGIAIWYEPVCRKAMLPAAGGGGAGRGRAGPGPGGGGGGAGAPGGAAGPGAAGGGARRGGGGGRRS